MQTQLDNASTVTYKKSWRVWWRLTRPHTLTASFVPVILGTVIAMNFGTECKCSTISYDVTCQCFNSNINEFI